MPWNTVLKVVRDILGEDCSGVPCVSATQHLIADEPAQRPLYVPPVHLDTLIHSPLNFWNGVVHWPVLWDASGFAGKNVPLPDEEVDGVGYLVGCVVGYLVGVTGEGVGNLAGVGTQQVMPAGPAHFPVTVDEDDEHSEVFLHSAALSPVYPP